MKQLLSKPLGALFAIALFATSAAVAAPQPTDQPPSGSGEMAAPVPVDSSAVAAVPISISQPLVNPPAPDTAAAAEVRYAELPNFHRVDDKLYRGGEPRAGGIARLKALGIGTVLDLRWERGKIREEKAAAEAAGLRYFSIPMYGLVRPKEEQIARALAIIADPANGPVFVHCERGSDRTGVVAACYRVGSMKWTADRAIDEAMALGMYRTERAKRTYIRDFSARKGG